jgi:hypothetical protein
VVEAPAIEGGQRVRRQALPAVDGGVDALLDQEASEGFVGVAIEFARGLFAAAQEAG